MPSLADLRSDYARTSLDEQDVAPEPLDQFARWFDEARAVDPHEVNAMTLATCGPGGRPAARIVLLKAFDAQGFVFYSNEDSAKGRDLAANPYAALLFHWRALERQVRVEGRVERGDDADADAYFASRPRESRLSACASPQSVPIADRGWLEARVAELGENFHDAPIPRPAHWRGFRVVPEAFEFWQGRASRLHDRIAYAREGGSWRIRRLAP